MRKIIAIIKGFFTKNQNKVVEELQDHTQVENPYKDMICYIGFMASKEGNLKISTAFSVTDKHSVEIFAQLIYSLNKGKLEELMLDALTNNCEDYDSNEYVKKIKKILLNKKNEENKKVPIVSPTRALMLGRAIKNVENDGEV